MGDTVEVDRDYHEALVATALFHHERELPSNELTPEEATRRLESAALL